LTGILQPESLDEALALRATHPAAAVVAGGTDLMVDVNFGRSRPQTLLDLSRVDELKEWGREQGVVRVGAGVTFARIARELADLRPLAEAARSVGSAQIRNRATIGGNVATASPAGDSLPVLAAYDAKVVVASVDRTRWVPWHEFFLAPKQTALAHDELIVRLEWRDVHGPGSFAKVGRRNAMVIAIAGAALQLDCDARRVRLALGSVGPTVLRAREAETLAEHAIDWEHPTGSLPPGTVKEFGHLAAAAAQPIDDLRASAHYRLRAVNVLARRELAWALDDRERAA